VSVCGSVSTVASCDVKLAANFVGLDAELLNRASALFIVSRIVFNHLYINQKTQVAASLRSGLFLVSLLCILFLGFKAGSALALASL